MHITSVLTLTNFTCSYVQSYGTSSKVYRNHEVIKLTHKDTPNDTVYARDE